MAQGLPKASLLESILGRIDTGIVVVDRAMEVLLWNGFMECHSGIKTADICGKNLFGEFPDLPEKWLTKKIQGVFLLRNFSFTSWEHRPYLFKFPQPRSISGGFEFMQQSCSFQPLINDAGEVYAVCIVINDVTDTAIYQRMLQASMAELKELSAKDSLTGLANRRTLEQQLEAEFRRFKRYGGALSVMLFDVDMFKAINDVHGHLAGDEVLKEIAGKLVRTMRATDFAGRFGGEEFVVVLTNTDIAGANIFSDRFLREVAVAPIVAGHLQIPVTISSGVSTMRVDTESYEGLLREADIALYRSKDGGRNQTTVYSQRYVG